MHRDKKPMPCGDSYLPINVRTNCMTMGVQNGLRIEQWSIPGVDFYKTSLQ